MGARVAVRQVLWHRVEPCLLLIHQGLQLRLDRREALGTRRLAWGLGGRAGRLQSGQEFLPTLAVGAVAIGRGLVKARAWHRFDCISWRHDRQEAYGLFFFRSLAGGGAAFLIRVPLGFRRTSFRAGNSTTFPLGRRTWRGG